MIETSLVPPRKSSASFGNLRKMFEKCSETFVKPLEQFWKIFGNLRLEIWNLSSRVHIRYLTRSLCSLVGYRCEHSKINSISLRTHVLFSIIVIVISERKTIRSKRTCKIFKIYAN